MGTIQNLGFFNLGRTVSLVDDLNGVISAPIRRIYEFQTGSVIANVAISTVANGSPTVQGADVNLRLFQDLNSNGTLDSGDPIVRIGAGRESDESLNANLRQGRYMAVVDSLTVPRRGERIPYRITISRASQGAANPLTSPEIPLGTIAQDLQRRNRVNDNDTADNFAFTLDGNSNLNIRVRELGNKKGDANIRVVQDLNGNGIVDRNEVVVRGTSSNKGNLDVINNLKSAGDYILQVCQSSGDTRFQVRFDHSPL